MSLKWFCCIRVRLYIKCLKLQTVEEYCQLLVYFINLQPEWSKICLTIWFTEIFNTRTQQIFNMNIKIKLKENDKIFFLGVSSMQYWPVLTFRKNVFPQLYCITEYIIGGCWIGKKRMCCLYSKIARKFGHSELRNYLRSNWTRFFNLAWKGMLPTTKT